MDEALRRLAATQDRRFRTELLVIALRNEAERPGRSPAGGTERPRRGVERLAAELDELAPQADDDIDQPPHHRTARNELARARGTATAEDWAEAVAAVAGRAAAAGGGVLPAAAGRVPRRRPAAGQGGGRGDARRATIAERLGATPIVAEVDALLGADPAVGGAGAAHAGRTTGPTD